MGRELLPNHGPGCGLARVSDERIASPIREPEEWLRITATTAPPGTGSECVVLDRATGELWVGKLLSYPADPFVEIELLGASHETKWLERDAAMIAELGPHRWLERRAVAERQKRGQPAAKKSVVAAAALSDLNSERSSRGWAARKALRGQGRRVPSDQVHAFAQLLGAAPSLVAAGYRMHFERHAHQPTDDELLEACACVELSQQEPKGTSR